MSARSELEAAQARVGELERSAITDAQLQLLADQLEREADAWELQLDRGEKRALKKDSMHPGARVAAFGFVLLAVGPIVAMIGFSLSKMIRHESELAWALVVLGAALVIAASWSRARRAVAHRFSSAWKLSRDARQFARSQLPVRNRRITDCN